MDSYGYPIYLILSEGQHNDITMAIPLLNHVGLKEGSFVLADKGYDSNALIDYIYERGAEPVIPSRKGAKSERRCDWWRYKERHLVEKLFLRLKAFRRIAMRYDKIAGSKQHTAKNRVCKNLYHVCPFLRYIHNRQSFLMTSHLIL